MPTRSFLWTSILGLSCLQTGCTLFETANTAMHDTIKVFKPHPTDYRNPADEVDPEWDLQKVGRGDRPMDTETDPVAKMITSPRARAIEHSLGVGY